MVDTKYKVLIDELSKRVDYIIHKVETYTEDLQKEIDIKTKRRLFSDAQILKDLAPTHQMLDQLQENINKLENSNTTYDVNNNIRQTQENLYSLFKTPIITSIMGLGSEEDQKLMSLYWQEPTRSNDDNKKFSYVELPPSKGNHIDKKDIGPISDDDEALSVSKLSQTSTEPGKAPNLDEEKTRSSSFSLYKPASTTSTLPAITTHKTKKEPSTIDTSESYRTLPEIKEPKKGQKTETYDNSTEPQRLPPIRP